MQRNEKKMERLFGNGSNSGMKGSISVPKLFLELAAEMEKTAFHGPQRLRLAGLHTAF